MLVTGYCLINMFTYAPFLIVCMFVIAYITIFIYIHFIAVTKIYSYK